MAERLGPYTLEKLIGSGGMADVFLATGPRGVCVVKRPHRQFIQDEEFVRMFLDEAATLAQLHHPGIAQIDDLGQYQGIYYLAMEYVPGFDLMTLSLEHERQGELMDPHLCARMIADAAAALHYAHEAVDRSGTPLNIVHRDISPHNILLSTSGIVKLIDFGVAKSASSIHRTQAGLVKGKYPYMAPEQLAGQKIDRRVDIYALGLVLYELLTNVRAVPGKSELEQIDNARAQKIRPIEQVRANTPVPLRQIIESCIRAQPFERYATASALKDDLEKYLSLEGHPVGQDDLLRLFRVVAAEVAAMSPPPPAVAVFNEAWRTTENNHPISAAIVPEGGAVADFSEASGSLKTRIRGQPEPILLTAEQRIDNRSPVDRRATEVEMPTDHAQPRVVRKTVDLRLVLAAAIAIVSMAIFTVLSSGKKTEELSRQVKTSLAHDLATPVLEVEPPVLPENEQQTADPMPQLAAAEESNLRVATVQITSDIPVDVSVGSIRYPRSPTAIDLKAGQYTLLLTNKAEHFRRNFALNLKPGERRVLRLRRGTLEFDVQPFASIRINQDEIGGAVSFKQLELLEGSYEIDLNLSGPDISIPRTKHLVVDVKPGATTQLKVNMLE